MRPKSERHQVPRKRLWSLCQGLDRALKGFKEGRLQSVLFRNDHLSCYVRTTLNVLYFLDLLYFPDLLGKCHHYLTADSFLSLQSINEKLDPRPQYQLTVVRK